MRAEAFVCKGRDFIQDLEIDLGLFIEAEINLIIHSYGGEIILEITEDGIVYLSFNDSGPGITDLEKALTPGFSTASTQAREFGFGAGMGLPNIKRVSDIFEINTSSAGTNLKIGFKI